MASQDGEISIVASMVETQRRRQELKAVVTRLERLYWALQDAGDQTLAQAVYQAFMWASRALAAYDRRYGAHHGGTSR